MGWTHGRVWDRMLYMALHMGMGEAKDDRTGVCQTVWPLGIFLITFEVEHGLDIRAGAKLCDH